VHAAAIDLARGRDDHAHPGGTGQYGLVQLLALGDRARLRIVELRERCADTTLETAVVEEHRCGHERPGERAPPRLVGAGDERHAESAVVAQQTVTGPEELAHRALTNGDGHAGERSATVPGKRSARLSRHTARRQF
jgi:hypothetical protein